MSQIQKLVTVEHQLAEQKDARIASLEAHLDGTRKALRIECADLGDNNWSDDLHLGDVIEKHLGRNVRERIEDLEAENARLTGMLDTVNQRLSEAVPLDRHDALLVEANALKAENAALTAVANTATTGPGDCPEMLEDVPPIQTVDPGEAFQGPGNRAPSPRDQMDALRSHERRDELGERLAERYTREDGSPK